MAGCKLRESSYSYFETAPWLPEFSFVYKYSSLGMAATCIASTNWPMLDVFILHFLGENEIFVICSEISTYSILLVA